MQADYVLPESTYLERMELPDYIGGKKQFVGMRAQAIEPIHPETKPCDEIFAGLAQACGVGEYFQFDVRDLAAAELETLGVDLGVLEEKGVIDVTAKPFEYGTPTFKTESGKFQFTSQIAEKAGLNPVIGYVERKIMPQGDELHFIGGKQGIHSHTMTQNVKALNTISREYNLERAWMSVQDAEARGIAEGDLVEITSSEHTGTVNVHVTQRLKPGVLYMPTHYGSTSPYQTNAYEYGLSMTEFVPFDAEPGVGSTMSQEVAVTVRKVEA